MKTITYYKFNGEIEHEVPLDKRTIKQCHGMKIRCVLLDGSERIGFANPFYSFEKGGSAFGPDADTLEYITLETFANLDDETHTFIGDETHKFDISREAVPLSIISRIDAILYSGLRWGMPPTNKFNLKTK